MGLEHGPSLSVCHYGMSVCDAACLGLGLVILVSGLVVYKMSPTIELVCILITSYKEVYHLFGDFLPDNGFSHLLSMVLRLSKLTRES